MNRIYNESLNLIAEDRIQQIGHDAGGRVRVSQFNTLFDGKIVGYDDAYMFDTKGTGTGLYGSNKYQLSVTEGQYLIRQSWRHLPYFSGKSQFVELTSLNFHTQAGVTKRYGYFSSTNIAPYATVLDGVFLEDNGVSKSLKAYRSGTVTINVPFEDMKGYAYIKDIDWSNFNVFAMDFLWLGGAIIRFFVKTNDGFVLIHTEHYASNHNDIFMLSPHQPVRCEIRSTTGIGTFTYVCSQVSTEGSIAEYGNNLSIASVCTAAIPSNTIATAGTTYPLISVKLQEAQRNHTVKIVGAAIYINSNTDVVRWQLSLNPTFASPMTYANVSNSAIAYAEGSSGAVAISNTVSNLGRVLTSGYISQGQQIPSNSFEQDYYSTLGMGIDNTPVVVCLSATAITASVTINGSLNLKEF